MTETARTDTEREQLAALLRKVIVDDDFRNSFEADPRAAIARSGIALSQEASDKLVQSVELVPSVMAHMEGTEDVSKAFFYAKVVED
jgi:putative modified peptide